MTEAITAIRRMWHSPTLQTWASSGARILTFLVVLPIVLRTLSPEEIAVWYLFGSVIALQTIADIGFAPSFARAIAYSAAGAASVEERPSGPVQREPNWTLTEAIVATMRPVYVGLSAVAVLTMLILATPALIRPISALQNPNSGWVSWAFVLLALGISTRANLYGAYLQGVNHVALYRRWEAISLIGASVTSIAVLLLGGRLLALVAASQAWVVVAALRDRALARAVENRRFATFARHSLDRNILTQLWERAWRSGIGIALSRGVLWSSGLLVAQFLDAEEIAVYLLALRLMQALSDFSSAPLYSKLPLLAAWYANGRHADILAVAERGMRLGFSIFVTGAVVLGLAGPSLLDALGSSIPFAPSALWIVLSLAFLVERYGAFHIQLYSTTNHIIWHIANGVTGSLFLIGAVALLPSIGIYAYPSAMLASYLSFYSWYAARHSYRAFGMNFLVFERRTSMIPLAAMLFYAGIVLLQGPTP